MKSSPSIWHYVVSGKSTVKILSIFVAFLENTIFKTNPVNYKGTIKTENFLGIQNLHSENLIENGL